MRRGEIIDDDMEDEFYLRRLDAGLFVLQLICYIMAEICNANVPQVCARLSEAWAVIFSGSSAGGELTLCVCPCGCVC